MSEVQFLREPVQVEAHISAGGLRPEAVRWQETDYAVVSVGRQWPAADGVHVLVEVYNGARMELVFGGNRWHLQRYWPVDGLV